jgi:hypothetical protein
MGRLTELYIQELMRKSEPVAIAVGDGSGLCFVIPKISKPDQPVRTGAAVWKLRYRHGGKAHWLTLGAYSEISLKEAKRRATKERAAIADGADPVGVRRHSEMALKTAKTFRELANDYIARALPDLAKSTQRDVRRFIDVDILPRIGELRIEEITGGEIVRMVEQIGKRSDSVARYVFSTTSVIFSHGMAKHRRNRIRAPASSSRQYSARSSQCSKR